MFDKVLVILLLAPTAVNLNSKFLQIIKNLFLQLAIRRNKTAEEIKQEENHVECLSLESSKIHPLDCCVYPRFCDALPDLLKWCADDCRSLPFPDFQCQRRCILFRNGWLVNGTQANLTAIVKSFHEGGEGELKYLSQIWLPIVENSAKFCEIEFPASNETLKDIPANVEDGAATVNVYFYYNNFVECVRKMNFVNCPEKLTKVSAECEKLNQTMLKCNTTDYSITHKLLFEDFYYRIKSNAK